MLITLSHTRLCLVPPHRLGAQRCAPQETTIPTHKGSLVNAKFCSPPPPGSPGLVGLAGLRCCVAPEPRHVVDWPQGPPAWVLPRDASVQPQDREMKSEYSAEDRGLFKRCRNDAGREKSLAGFPCAVHRGIRVYVGCTQVTNGFGVGHAGRGTRLWRRQRFLINCARSLICTLT